MTVEADIYNALKDIVGGRVFPDDAPLSTNRPYITYQQIGGQAINFIDNTDPNLKNARMQINVWADTRISASVVAALVESAMRGATVFSARPESAFAAERVPEANLYGTRQDFTIWYQVT